jgi:DoxX-like family
LMKALQPLDQLAVMMKWIPDFPVLFVRTLGIVEVLGAIGLILPSLTRIQPRLTVLAALCILVHQFCAVVLHLSKGEADVLGLNAVLIALAVFILWVRPMRNYPPAGRGGNGCGGWPYDGSHSRPKFIPSQETPCQQKELSRLNLCALCQGNRIVDIHTQITHCVLDIRMA